MDEQAKIVWDFLETAFRTGTLDKVLDLVGIMAGKDLEDMSEAFNSLEDIFLEMEDASVMEEKFDMVYQVLEALTDDEVMDGLGTLISLLTPLLRLVKMQAGDDDLLTPEKQAEIKAKAANLFKALKTAGLTGARLYLTGLDGKSVREYGQGMGKTLNMLLSAGDDLVSDQSGGASDFMAGLFDTMDGQAVRRMTDTMTDGFLDQRPPIIRWTAATAVRVAKKRLLNR